MNNLFEYIDYRKYLAEFYTYKKQTTRAFSYRYFSAKAGFSSPVFLKLVIDGKRNLSRASIEKFCKALGLNAKESIYFKNLVLFDQATTVDEKQENYAVLRSLMNAVRAKTIESDQYEYFGTWYHVIIRELITLFNFQEDYQVLAQSIIPAITPGEAKRSVALLLKLNLIYRLENGTYAQTDTAITAREDIGALAIRHFNRMMLQHGVTAIDAFPTAERHVSGITVGISSAMYGIIEAEIQAFKERIITLVNRDDAGKRVFQLNLQFFPVSKAVDAIRPDRKGQI
jgi:uncharacterized protein (TIGR02147 family)